jgi:AcrR family transcriptional regulator
MPRVVHSYRSQAIDTILESASQLFFELGYEETTMDDIAGRIGVTKGTLYLYFKNKEELLYRVCKKNMKLLEDTLKDTVSADLLEGASKFFRAELKLPDHLRFHWIFALGEIKKNPSVRKILMESYENYISMISSRIEELKDGGLIPKETNARALSAELIAFHNGIMMSMMLGLTESDAVAIVETGVRSILKNASQFDW